MVPCSSCGAPAKSDSADCPSCAKPLVAGPDRRLKALAAVGFSMFVSACYGVADGSWDSDTSRFEDKDEDGYEAWEDCDDENAAINPGAEEREDDGLDSNCNGDDNT